MQIDTQLIPLPPEPKMLLEKNVVVIDVLRATSVIVYALSQGALEIIPATSIQEAKEKANAFSQGTTLLGGERGSLKIEGFDLGNSPMEYLEERIKGKRIILTTTNGTRAFHLVSSGHKIFIGSFLNIEAIAKRCLEFDQDLLIFLSGDRGSFSLEDTVCAGMLIDLILKNEGKQVALTDASYAALFLYQRFEANLLGAFHLSQHGKDLFELGGGEDLIFCAQTNITKIVPLFKDGVIRIS
ncbi:MAG: 2-phosphosulfolactate phosphatase [Thermodesulfobacteriota bacterium]